MKNILLIALVLFVSSCGASEKPKFDLSHSLLQKKTVEVSKFNDILDLAEAYKIYETKTALGKKVIFTVIREYFSASKKLCKKFLLNEDIFLACKQAETIDITNNYWYNLRSFE